MEHFIKTENKQKLDITNVKVRLLSSFDNYASVKTKYMRAIHAKFITKDLRKNILLGFKFRNHYL